MWNIFLELLPNVILGGLILGFIYALIAVGYTLVYGVLQLINFSHSEIFMIGAVAGIETMRGLQNTPLPGLIQLLLALIIGALIAASVAVIVERCAYRPLRKRGSKNRLIPLITAIGVSFILQDLVKLIESVWHQEFFITFPSLVDLNTAYQLPLNMHIQLKSIIMMIIAIIMGLVLYYIIHRTRLGYSIRAVAQNPQSAQLMGISPDNVIAKTFALGGAMGGIAGVLFALQYNTVNPYIGFMPGIKAFTAAVLGGIGSVPGALLGGVILGQLETLAGTYLPLFTHGDIGTEYKDMIAFLILILILLFKPQGLLGKNHVEKI